MRWATRGQALYQFKAKKAARAVQTGNVTLAARVQSGKDEDFALLEDEDRTYQDAVKTLVRDLDLGLPVQTIDRSLTPTYDFGLSVAVVVLGQDGLVANTAKYVGDVPIVGVNPDPGRFDGVLLPFRVAEARGAVQAVLAGKARSRRVTLAEVQLQDGQRMLAFNDLFVGVRSHVSARYQLRVGGKAEAQSSSGVLIATGAGSTGWLSSVFNMVSGIAGARLPAGPALPRPALTWEDPRLVWAVREPFVSRTSRAGLVYGTIEAGARIEIESMTPENGVIFSDGIESDFLEFNAGTIAAVGAADQRARLVVRADARV